MRQTAINADVEASGRDFGAGEGVWSLHVLGTSADSVIDLGASGAGLERDRIPMLLSAAADTHTPVAHDCTLHGNPSHTGVGGLEREYPAGLREWLLLYCDSEANARALRELRFKVVAQAGRYPLHASLPVRMEEG